MRAGRVVARDDVLGERVLEVVLHCALERPCAVLRVPTHLREVVLRRSGQLDGDFALRKALREPPELDVDDLVHLLTLESMEDHHLVEAIDELRTHRLAHVLEHGTLDELTLVLGR